MKEDENNKQIIFKKAKFLRNDSVILKKLKTWYFSLYSYSHEDCLTAVTEMPQLTQQIVAIS